jgi:CheY-like chemotaxis protein
MAKILAVDDDPLLLELMKDMLADAGHVVVGVSKAMDCLTKLRDGGYQLAILDVDMPQLSGLELLRLIRRDPALRAVSVLMCTGRGTMGDLDAAFEIGANGYIVKPFSAASLAEGVAKGLSGKGRA